MLRIERVEHDGRTVVSATGRLVGAWVAELRASVDSVSGPVLVDLTDVSFVDRDGARLLRELTGRAAVQLRCSPFVTAQIA